MKRFIFQLIMFCCMIPVVLAQNKIKQYEYWIDNNVAGRQTVKITPATTLDLNTSIQIDGLTPGLHTLNLRFMDVNNNYSPIITKTIDAFSANPQISAYEYWYDNDFINKTTVQITPSKIVNVKNFDLSAMPEGRHFFNIRFRDLSSKWSAIQQNIVFKSKVSNKSKNSIAGYRYWIDNNFVNSKYTALNENTANTNFMESIDMTSYPISSNHQLYIQFLDAYGLWSSVQSTFFMNSGGGTLLFNAITGYRYWIEGNFNNNIFKEINPAFASVNIDENIDLNNFKGNDRKLYFQFKDAIGLWSSITTDTVTIKNTVGFENINAEGVLKIFPNPNRGEFVLSLENEINDALISISNTLGEIIYNKKSDIIDRYRIQLNNIQPGLYFIRLTDSKNNKIIHSGKFIIKN